MKVERVEAVRAYKPTTPEQRESRRIYDTAAWKKLRTFMLHRNPFCLHCLDSDRYTVATEVDHIKPISSGGAKLCTSNLQCLCKPCHSAKTKVEQGGAGLKL